MLHFSINRLRRCSYINLGFVFSLVASMSAESSRRFLHLLILITPKGLDVPMIFNQIPDPGKQLASCPICIAPAGLFLYSKLKFLLFLLVTLSKFILSKWRDVSSYFHKHGCTILLSLQGALPRRCLSTLKRYE